ncbi:unnamed protein product [Trifolium pratense]|uniref:Uncharacterized protein n=1 Tax=Trifolium pratense TaxID=57577 RepID=A0ACB0J999_TRIPR|nr:unnamed protein product [Trifolium pratense]
MAAKVPNWLALPKDITANILSRLSTIEIVTSVCKVCPYWWNIFKDPLMWRTIHMTEYISIFCDDYQKYEYEQMFCYAVKRSCGHLEDVDIWQIATDDLLQCIAENASNLRSMRIVGSDSISNKGFSEAVRKLSRLEELDISGCEPIQKDSLEVIGMSCPLLKSLKFGKTRCPYIWRYDDDDDDYDDDDDDEALIISETMSRLSCLDISGNKLTNFGLVAILDGCPRLEHLDIQQCYNISLNENLRKRCIEQIKDLRLSIRNNYEDFDGYFNRVTYRDSIYDRD